MSENEPNPKGEYAIVDGKKMTRAHARRLRELAKAPPVTDEQLEDWRSGANGDGKGGRKP